MYKRDEGMWARVPTAMVGGAITVYATMSVVNTGAGIAPWIIGGIVFLGLAAVTLYFTFFHAKMSDVLIDTETEMRKVVWPNREEVAGSTIVVVVTTVLMGLVIFVIDVALTQALRIIRLYS